MKAPYNNYRLFALHGETVNNSIIKAIRLGARNSQHSLESWMPVYARDTLVFAILQVGK